jgi:hypothetical protein
VNAEEEIRTAMLRKVHAQLQRHNSAGVPLSKTQAIRMVLREEQERLRRMADIYDQEGDDNQADIHRELAQRLEYLFSELGLR